MAALDDATIALAADGRLDEMRTLLANVPEIARTRGPGEETLLHVVARQWPKLRNGAEIARVLLAAGADVNAADAEGLRPIQGATGDLPLTRVLLEAGAETAVYSTGHMNMGPAEVSLFCGLWEEARLMVDYGAAVDLRVASGIGDLVASVGFLGADGAFRADAIGLPGQPGPEISVEEGVIQALSYAARNGQVPVVGFLLDQGADIDALVPHFDIGCAPLHQAVSGNHPVVAEFLIARGARRDVRDDRHKATALEWAEEQKKPDMIAILSRA